MSFSKTKFNLTNIETDIRGRRRKVSHHKIDQLPWYRESAMSTLKEAERELRENYASAVMFELPKPVDDPSHMDLTVFGDGYCFIAAYFSGDGTFDKLFSYDRDTLVLGDFHDELDDLDHRRIFTTRLAPFLRGGDYPEPGTRVYSIFMQSEMGLGNITPNVDVVVENERNAEDESLEVIFSPDSRKANPIQIGTVEYIDGKGRTIEKIPDPQEIKI